jgi:Zn-dependent protease
MNLFSIRGIRLQMHFSFFLLLAYVAQDGWNTARWPGLLWSLGTILAFFACVVLHELGHSFTAMHFGIGVRRILLMPIGGMAEFDDIPRQPLREFLITIAGPAVNFAIVAAMLFLPIGDDNETTVIYSLGGLLEQLFIANLAMGCFNLLPAFPMDGGRILRALLATRLPYLRATFWAATAGKVLAGLGVVFALSAHTLHFTERPLYMLAVLFSFIFIAGEIEYRSVKRREIDDANWRIALDRLHAAARQDHDTPPLLRT